MPCFKRKSRGLFAQGIGKENRQEHQHQQTRAVQYFDNQCQRRRGVVGWKGDDGFDEMTGQKQGQGGEAQGFVGLLEQALLGMNGAGLASGGGGIVARLAMFARVWEFKLDVLEDGGDGPGGGDGHVLFYKFESF